MSTIINNGSTFAAAADLAAKASWFEDGSASTAVEPHRHQESFNDALATIIDPVTPHAHHPHAHHPDDGLASLAPAGQHLADLLMPHPSSSFIPAPGWGHAFRGDASAATAIQTLKTNEALASAIAAASGGPANRLTADELVGAVLEGTADPGNEAQELRQLQSFAQEEVSKLDAPGRRVARVVDRYLATAERRPDGSLTQAEKAQMAKDLAAAAEPHIGDHPIFIA